jgi:hypothetical protein
MIRVASRATHQPLLCSFKTAAPTATIPQATAQHPDTQPTCQIVYGDFVSKRFTSGATLGNFRYSDAT